MKYIQYYFFVAVATIALASCSQKENPSVTPEGPCTYVIAIDNETKAVFDEDHMAWEEGDCIGWFTDKAGSSEVDMNTDPRSFTVSSTAPMGAGSTIYAYAPYKAGEQSKTAAPLTIPVSQNGANIRDAMPLAALPLVMNADMEPGADTPVGTAQFVNLGAIIRYNVYSSNEAYAAEAVESVTFTANAPIAGDFTMDLTELDIDAVEQGTLPDLSAALTEDTVISALSNATVVGGSKENGVKIYQVVASGGHSGTITVTTDKAVYTYTLADALDFERAHLLPLNLDLGSSKATRLTETEQILVGSKWKLSDYYESWADDHITDQYNVMNDGGSSNINLTEPRLVFSANHSFSLDHFHYFKDLGYYEGPIPTDANGKWALNSDNSVLSFSDGAFPIVLINSYPATSEWTVVSLSSSELHIVTFNDEQWVNLVFVPDDSTPGVETTWDHSFVTGDFGLTAENIWADPITDTLGEKSWTLANNQGAYKLDTPWGWSGMVIWNGWGWAYEPTWVTLTSADFSGTITSVSLDFTIGQNWEITANCSIGGAAFGVADQHFTNAEGEEPQQAVTFTGSASGTIVITVTQPAETGVPILLRGIHVTYIPD